MKQFCVYIMASRPGGALYIGVTSDLLRRVDEHKSGKVKGHTRTYGIKDLVYYEIHESAESAILREKRLKKWSRDMKNDLIDRHNPVWEDLLPKLAHTGA